MNIKSIKFFLFSAVNYFLLSVFVIANAQAVVVPTPPALIPNPLGEKNDTLFKFINLLLDTIFPIASLVAVFFLIYAGFKMVIAGGNEEKLKEAKTAFLWTVIGIAILLGAKVLSAVICGTINQLGTPTLSCPTP